MSNHFNDPHYWRARSDEIRAIAEGLKDPDAQRMLLSVASDYDKLAPRRTAVGARREVSVIGC